MGKQKHCLEQLIKDTRERSIYYSKQKRNLIKKAIELSVMCNQNITITIFDQNKNNLVQYCSQKEFNPNTASKMLSSETLHSLNLQMYTNDDYKNVSTGRKIRMSKSKTQYDQRILQKTIKAQQIIEQLNESIPSIVQADQGQNNQEGDEHVSLLKKRIKRGHQKKVMKNMLNLPTSTAFTESENAQKQSYPIPPYTSRLQSMPTTVCFEEEDNLPLDKHEYIRTESQKKPITKSFFGKQDVSLINSDCWSAKNDDDNVSEKDYISDSESSFEPITPMNNKMSIRNSAQIQYHRILPDIQFQQFDSAEVFTYKPSNQQQYVMDLSSSDQSGLKLN